MAAPIVGENDIGIRQAWRSFQAAMSRSASSSTWARFLLRGLTALIPQLAAVEAQFARDLNAMHNVIRW